MFAAMTFTTNMNGPRSALFLLSALLILLPSGSVKGQEIPGSSTPSKTKKFADLTGRYRFSERYTTEEKDTGPGVVGSYRVAVREVTRDSVESAQGAPRRVEATRQAIYSERPSEMGGGVGVVASSGRVVEKYLARPEDASKAMGSRPLEGVSVLLRPKLGELPLAVCLTDNRTLTEFEFEALCRSVYVPHLPALLPTQAVRLGDTWRVARKGAQALLGDPFLQTDTLTGKLAEIRKEVDGPRMVASIAITGKAVGPAGETTVNAEALFVFQGSSNPKDPARKPTFPPSPSEDMTEARGAFTEVLLASVASGPLPGPGRLRYQSNRELTLHRQLGVAPGGVAPPLVEKSPEPTEANSWLAHVDPSGRYAFRHPQDLLPPGRTQPPAEANTTLLVRTRRDAREVLQVEFFDKTLNPEDLKKELVEKYGLLKSEVLNGEEAWLPEAEWPGMRVHRIDAAVKLGDPKSAAKAGGPPRVHFDGYLIQFARTASILAIATTSKDSAAPFRREVEQILKSLQLDPAKSLPIDKAPNLQPARPPSG